MKDNKGTGKKLNDPQQNHHLMQIKVPEIKIDNQHNKFKICTTFLKQDIS